MSGFAVDEAAWASPWRARAVGDKALASAALLIAALTLPAWPGAVVVLLLVVGGVAWARIRPRVFLRAMAVPLVFILIGAGTVGLRLAWPPVTPQGLAEGGQVLIRALAGTAAVLLFACSTPMVDVLAGLRRLRMPAPLVDVISLMYKMIFVLADTAARMRDAQASRLGYASARAARRSMGLLLARLLVRSWERALALQGGLEGRGYETDMTVLVERRRHQPGFVGLALGGVLLAVVVSLAWGWGR